ncbi:hypothetical protein C8J57DRAFT_1233080 [Mycena rebaudengoi]|nr:hypothetical protein C8J57DRAFT_1233080 [Mycena rebaudengoi]
MALRRIVMGKHPTRAQQEKKASDAFRPKLSDEERRRRGREATKAHYHSAAKKLAKRKWDPPKKEWPQKHKQMQPLTAEGHVHYLILNSCQPGIYRELDSSIFNEIGLQRDAEERLNSEESEADLHHTRPATPTFRELDGSGLVDTTVVSAINEAIVSQALLDMAGQKKPAQALPSRSVLPMNEAWSPLPPSSPPPASPIAIEEGCRRKSWVSPGEWEDPGSPLPNSADERMPWPYITSTTSIQIWLLGTDPNGVKRRRRKVSKRFRGRRAPGQGTDEVHAEEVASKMTPCATRWDAESWSAAYFQMSDSD